MITVTIAFCGTIGEFDSIMRESNKEYRITYCNEMYPTSDISDKQTEDDKINKMLKYKSPFVVNGVTYGMIDLD